MKARATTLADPASAAAYEADFYTWTQEQGARLRTGDLDALDRANLAEEIESLGRSQFDRLVSAWRIVLLHMLKVDYQPSRRTRSWAISIAAHRDNAADILADNPGLRRRVGEAIERAYRGARLEASKETRLPLMRYPASCSYTHDEIVHRAFAIDPDDGTP